MRRILVLICVGIIFFNNITYASSGVRKIRVSTSIFILSTIVKDIGGNRVDVSYVIPPSANPHVFSPSPRDLLVFANSDVFIGVGYGFEFWFNRIKYLRKNKRVMFLSDFYKYPIGNKNVINPHIWLDMRFIRNVAVDKIASELCGLDVENCSYFKRNASKLKERITKVFKVYVDFSKELKRYCIIDIKPAFEYLLRSVGLRSCYVVIKEGSAMPSVRDLDGVFRNCRCKKGLVIYIQHRGLAFTIAHAKRYKIVQLNPLGSPSACNQNDYVKLLKYDLNQLKKALSK